MENQNNPPVPSITQLFNLLALRNKLHLTLDFFCRHEVFLYSTSKVAFRLFGNILHITGIKINRQILNKNVNK
jgi:hypothetical protein